MVEVIPGEAALATTYKVNIREGALVVMTETPGHCNCVILAMEARKSAPEAPKTVEVAVLLHLNR